MAEKGKFREGKKKGQKRKSGDRTNVTRTVTKNKGGGDDKEEE